MRKKGRRISGQVSLKKTISTIHNPQAVMDGRKEGDVMRKQISWMSVLSCLLLLVASCASIVGKSVYPVAITSQPDQADISITDETGKTIFTGKTPTTVTLNTKAGYFSGKD